MAHPQYCPCPSAITWPSPLSAIQRCPYLSAHPSWALPRSRRITALPAPLGALVHHHHGSHCHYLVHPSIALTLAHLIQFAQNISPVCILMHLAHGGSFLRVSHGACMADTMLYVDLSAHLPALPPCLSARHSIASTFRCIGASHRVHHHHYSHYRYGYLMHPIITLTLTHLHTIWL